MVFGGADVPRDKDGFPVLPPGYPRHLGIGVNGRMRETARALPPSALQDILASPLYLLDAPHMVDHTGLTGAYDFKLEFPTRIAGEPPGDWAFAVFTAVEKQLGLSLKRAKVQVEVLVIDHIDKVPTEN